MLETYQRLVIVSDQCIDGDQLFFWVPYSNTQIKAFSITID